MKRKLLDRIMDRLVGPPPENLEDTSERLATTRAMVQELAGKDAATQALIELDALAEKRRKEGDR